MSSILIVRLEISLCLSLYDHLSLRDLRLLSSSCSSCGRSLLLLLLLLILFLLGTCPLMSRAAALLSKVFSAIFALEWPLLSVRPHVFNQPHVVFELPHAERTSVHVTPCTIFSPGGGGATCSSGGTATCPNDHAGCRRGGSQCVR